MFTRVELTDWNTPRLFLMFHIHLHLLSIAFWKLWFNPTMESFKSSCIWKHPLFCWWFSSKTEVKNNDYYVQIFLFYLLIFSHWFLKSNQISSFFLHILWKLFFPGQTPVPPRSWLWILDLSHDPFWAIWLAEVTKSHRHHDRMVHHSCKQMDKADVSFKPCDYWRCIHLQITSVMIFTYEKRSLADWLGLLYG